MRGWGQKPTVFAVGWIESDARLIERAVNAMLTRCIGRGGIEATRISKLSEGRQIA
jgi:hypothetical protein